MRLLWIISLTVIFGCRSFAPDLVGVPLTGYAGVIEGDVMTSLLSWEKNDVQHIYYMEEGEFKFLITYGELTSVCWMFEPEGGGQISCPYAFAIAGEILQEIKKRKKSHLSFVAK